MLILIYSFNISDAVYEIWKTNRRRKSGGNYLTESETFGGCYSVAQLGAMANRKAIINQALKFNF